MIGHVGLPEISFPLYVFLPKGGYLSHVVWTDLLTVTRRHLSSCFILSFSQHEHGFYLLDLNSQYLVLLVDTVVWYFQISNYTIVQV